MPGVNRSSNDTAARNQNVRQVARYRNGLYVVLDRFLVFLKAFM